MRDRFVANQFVVFSFLWAVAHIAHLMRKGSLTNPACWMLLACSLLVLANPRSRARLVMLGCAQLLLLFSRMPFTDNHLYIMGFVNAGLLVGLLSNWTRESNGESSHLGAALAYARLTLIIAYSGAALAKLNRGFFDVAGSCAVTMFYDAADVFALSGRFLPADLEMVLPFTIAGLELAIPLLLVIPWTRLAGIIVVVLFHWAMSLSPTTTAIDFTVILFALVFLFLPPPAAGRSRRWLEGFAAKVPDRLRHNGPTRLVVGLLAFGILGAVMVLRPATVGTNHNWVLLAAAALVIGGALIHLARAALGAPSHATASWRLSLLHVALLVLLVVNVGAPYLGIKTAGTFTMYSNLQTAGGTSNHFLFPRLPYETRLDDLVRVVESSNSRLQRVGDRGAYITWHEVRRHLSNDPDASISYVRSGGDVVTLAQAREVPELVRRDLVAHRVLGYREYDPLARCDW